MAKKLLIGFFLAGAITMFVMSLHYFQFDVTGILKGKEISNSLWYRLFLKAHILTGIIAITIGPFQFIHQIRSQSISTHKYLGYTYVINVTISSISGLVVAQFAMGGWITAVGFSTLSIFWLFSTLSGVVSICRKEVSNHKKWMYISYALTFAAIPQRTLLLLPLLTSVPFMPVYRLSAWLPWMLNAGIAFRLYNLLINKTKSVKL